MYKELIDFIRSIFGKPDGTIALHEPFFGGNEKKYVNDAIDSTFVSSVGEYVNHFEGMMCDITGARYAIACVNGTAGLHAALILSGVKKGNEVITQPLSFIATANAIAYSGAKPLFIDVDLDTLGLSPVALLVYLKKNAFIDHNGSCINKSSGNMISACIPMHTFGMPTRIEQIVSICKSYNIPVIEDAAESLGSEFMGKHTGTFGKLGVYSFNGNKIVTSGGGGCIVTNDEQLAKKAKHITTTAKVPHRWEYFHDEMGYNYRLTNLSAALACAQLEQLPNFLINKRKLSDEYKGYLKDKTGISYVNEPANTSANFWLNAILLPDRKERDDFLLISNNSGIQTRPIWTLIHKMPMYSNALQGNLQNAEWLENRVVNLPSSVRKNHL